MHNLPSPTASYGRDARGRFAAGNTFARGNPHARRVQQIRAALLEAVTEEDVHQIARALVEKAKAGDVTAAREVLDRCLGKAKQPFDLEVEASHPRCDHCLDFENMSDLEIAQVIRAAGVKLPPILERKVQRILEQQEAERAARQAAEAASKVDLNAAVQTRTRKKNASK